MTTTITGWPPARPFSPAECAALATAGIIAADEAGLVLTGARRFSVDEYLAMERAGILHEDDRVELMDGEIIIMAPIGDYHVGSANWLNTLLTQALSDRAMVQAGAPIYLNDGSAPQPDIAVVRRRPIAATVRSFPPDVYLVIEVADSSLPYDSGPKLARYAESGIPEVWIANLRERIVTAYSHPSGSQYAVIRTFHPGQTISPLAFPDISLRVDDFMPPPTGPYGELA